MIPSIGEFALIAQHFSTLGARRDDLCLGVGDDAAILDPTANSELCSACACIALTRDPTRPPAQTIVNAIESLVSSLHDSGFKAAWATLVLTLTRPDELLAGSVAAAVHSVCIANDIAVIGGDTTSGEDSLTVFLTGTRT